MYRDAMVRTMTEFLGEIGIGTAAASSLAPTLFPGLDIQYGAVLIDETRLEHPGDILHEAGHVAVTQPQLRGAFRLEPSGGQELAAMAWSYAAAAHLGLAPDVVLYPSSYHGLGDELVEAFGEGRFVGTPLLQAFAMTVEPRYAAARGLPPFPHMLRWLR
jgi:hypothetical protein